MIERRSPFIWMEVSLKIDKPGALTKQNHQHGVDSSQPSGNWQLFFCKQTAFVSQTYHITRSGPTGGSTVGQLAVVIGPLQDRCRVYHRIML